MNTAICEAQFALGITYILCEYITHGIWHCILICGMWCISRLWNWFWEFQQSFIKSDIKGRLSEYIVYGKKKRVCGTCLSVRMQYVSREYISSWVAIWKLLAQSIYSSPPLNNREWARDSYVLGKRSSTDLHLQSWEACIFNERNNVSIHSRTKGNTDIFLSLTIRSFLLYS